MIRNSIFFSVFILTISFSSVGFNINLVSPPDSLAYKKNPIYQRQLDLFELNKIKQADIVMLGNSLTNGANWNELLGRHSVVERGIVSDVLEGFSNRMRYVYELKPKIVFILGGLNDIYNWVPVEQIYQDYVKIIEGLKARRITPVIQSTLYAGRDWGRAWLEANRPDLNVTKYNDERNGEVDKLNKMLYNYAKVNNIEYINLVDKMSRGHFLKNELTYDGAHLNANGYKIWIKEIENILKKYGL